MEFGLDKCAKGTFKREKLRETKNIELDVGTAIQDLEQECTYTYLGVNEGDGIQHAQMKEKIRKEYYRRIRLVLKSELNAANRMDAINTLAVPVVTYSFNTINWKMKERKKLDRKTRKLVTMAKMHHPKADVDRVYIPRKAGGRGLVQLETTYKTTTIGLNTYLNKKDDYLVKIAKDLNLRLNFPLRCSASMTSEFLGYLRKSPVGNPRIMLGFNPRYSATMNF